MGNKKKEKKSILDLAKEFISKLAEDTANKGESLEIETLEVGAVALIDGESAPDGDYVFEDGSTVVIKDGLISEIKPVEEIEMADEVVEDELVEDEKEEKPKEEKENKGDNLNLENLKQLLSIQEGQNSSGSISFEIVNGELIWGEMYSANYKTLMHSNDSNVSKIKSLETEKADYEKAIVELTEAIRSSNKLNQAPVVNLNKESRIAMLKKGR